MVEKLKTAELAIKALMTENATIKKQSLSDAEVIDVVMYSSMNKDLVDKCLSLSIDNHLLRFASTRSRWTNYGAQESLSTTTSFIGSPSWLLHS